MWGLQSLIWSYDNAYGVPEVNFKASLYKSGVMQKKGE